MTSRCKVNMDMPGRWVMETGGPGRRLSREEAAGAGAWPGGGWSVGWEAVHGGRLQS